MKYAGKCASAVLCTLGSKNIAKGDKRERTRAAKYVSANDSRSLILRFQTLSRINNKIKKALYSTSLTCMVAATSAPNPLVFGASWATTQRPVRDTDSQTRSTSQGRMETKSRT